MKWGVRRYQPYPKDSYKGRYIGGLFRKKVAQQRLSNDPDVRKRKRLEFQINQRLEAGKTYYKLDGRPEKLSKIPRKNITTIEDDLQYINPTKHTKEGREFNCINCVCALEMRQRGYDVQARRIDVGSGLVFYRRWFKNPQMKTVNDKISMLSDITLQGDSRGYVAVEWKLGGRHTFSYAVKDKKTAFYDPQSGKVYPDSIFDRVVGEIEYGRLDNLEVSPTITESVVTRRKNNQ